MPFTPPTAASASIAVDPATAVLQQPSNFFTANNIPIGAQIQNRVSTITSLSSGSGSLSAVPTANGAAALNSLFAFLNGTIPQIWLLRAGTDATGDGIQRPNDYNASTNAVVWQQFI